MSALMNIVIGILRGIVQHFFMRRITSRGGAGPLPPMAVTKIDGAEYLLAAAGSSIDQPHVKAFRELLLMHEVTEDLSEKSLAVLAVVSVAAQTAARRGDLEGMKEAIQIGLKTALRFDRGQ